MPITFYIPAPLRPHSNGQSKVEINAAVKTAAEALAVLWREYPGLRDRVVNEQGEVRQHINIFVGQENTRDCGGLAAPVGDGVTITIVPAVSGG